MALAVARLALPPDASAHVRNGFAAGAHLFVGGLLGAFAVNRRWALAGIAGALSAVELFAFFTK